MEIKGSVAVVTGGASGLGEATVRYLVENGASVSIFDLAEERGRNVAAELGASAVFCKMDVTDPGSVQAGIDKTMDAFGAIHIAVNCAGVATSGKVLGKEGPWVTGNLFVQEPEETNMSLIGRKVRLGSQPYRAAHETDEDMHVLTFNLIA